MAYRDDRQALHLQVAELERENEDLKKEVLELRDDARKDRAQEHEDRRSGALHHCAVCGGSLLAVAVFAGRDHRAPIPLRMSTLRFGDPGGGFSRSAPLKSMVCSSCGFIHTFIDIDSTEGSKVTAELEAELTRDEDLDEDPDDPEQDA